VRVHEIGQLFNSLGPSPFAELDLDDDAEAYLVGRARAVDARGPFRIVVHCRPLKADNGGSAIRLPPWAVTSRTRPALERDLSDLFRVGGRSLAIGMAVIGVSIGLSQAVRTALPDSALALLLAEGIMIFGWIANWRDLPAFFGPRSA
jgi:hypothetical protein